VWLERRTEVGAPITAGTSLSGKRVDLRDIRIVKKGGGTIDDSEMVDGLVFEHKASKAAGGPTKVTGAKIALIQFCVSPPKTDLESNIVLSGLSLYPLTRPPPPPPPPPGSLPRAPFRFLGERTFSCG